MNCYNCNKVLSRRAKGNVCNKCPRPLEWRQKIAQTKMAELNPQWKGNKVGYGALHEWVANHFPKPKLCQNCRIKLALDLANISQKYKRDLTDWEWLCRRCHMQKDGRMEKLHSPEIALKISKTLKGYKKSAKHIENIRLSKLGITYLTPPV